MDVKVVKKDGTIQNFNGDKIKIAVSKSAKRAMLPLTEEQKDKVVMLVKNKISELYSI